MFANDGQAVFDFGCGQSLPQTPCISAGDITSSDLFRHRWRARKANISRRPLFGKHQT